MAPANFSPKWCASRRCRAALRWTSVFAAWSKRAENFQRRSVFCLRCAKLRICSPMTLTHDTRNFFLEGPAGRLEAILWKPSSPARPPLAAVVCHPHPLFGGTMHNKVVYQTAKSLDALGIPVLRFNFRGAGLSAGVHDHGLGERDDVRAALDFLTAEFPGVPLLLAGFSFGALVGLRAGCEHPRVSHLIGLGIPVDSNDFSFLRQCNKPKLFVHGSNDEYGALATVKTLVASLPGENELIVVEGVDHFFAGKLPQLDAAIHNWFNDEVFRLRRARRVL